jgi:1-acyl-sn-glycerol-3-phosphate acyltransferase
MIARTLAFVARLMSGSTVRWRGELHGESQCVFYANHTSHLDFMVIWSALPPALRAKTRPVAGNDYWGKGPIRRYLAVKVFNAILIDRAPEGNAMANAARSIESIASGMGDRFNIIVFPEGTRSLTGELKPFKSGLFHLCRMKPHLDLYPVYLANMNRILPKGEVLPVPLVGGVVIGEPIRMEPGEEKQAFLSRAREHLLELRAS